jgi:hypothetical protein
MTTTFKYGVSAIAILAAASLAQAQTNDRQGGAASERSMGQERGGQSEHFKTTQGERGQQGGQERQGRGRSAEREQGAQQQKGGRTAEESQQGGNSQQQRSAQEREQGGKSAEGARNQDQGQQAQRERGERSAKADRENSQQRARPEESREGERGREAQEKERGGESGREARERDTGGARSTETRERQTEGGGREGRMGADRERGRLASISSEQRTRIHGILVRESGIHRYHRGDVDFNVRVGTRIPNTIEFYDPPAQIVQINPVFRGFKIVLLDDAILVIDPATREIVDVLRA